MTEATQPEQTPPNEPSAGETSEGQSQPQGISLKEHEAEVARRIQEQSEKQITRHKEELSSLYKDLAETVRENPAIFKTYPEKYQQEIASILGETVEDLLNSEPSDDSDDLKLRRIVGEEYEKRQNLSEKQKIERFIEEQTSDEKLSQIDKDAIRKEFESVFSKYATPKRTLDEAKTVMELARIKVLGDKALEERTKTIAEAQSAKAAANLGINPVNTAAKKEYGQDVLGVARLMGISEKDLDKYSK